VRHWTSFYKPLEINPESDDFNYLCYENTSLNFVANF
jgi:hypothetical protein